MSTLHDIAGRARLRVVLLATILVSAGPALAQPTPGSGGVPAGAPAAEPTGPVEQIRLTAGRSTVLTTSFDISRLAITNPAVADAVVVQPREVLIDGKGGGTVSLIIWGPGERKHYDVIVDPGVSALQQQLRALFPGEDINVNLNQDAIVLSGGVSSTATMLRAGEIASASAAKSQVINLLQVPGGSESQQVLLQVRFAEVNRRTLLEAGFNFFAIRPNYLARSTTQQFAAPDFDSQGSQGVDGLVFSDYLNLFFFHRKEGLGAVLKALQQTGDYQSLAEPNLIAYNGQEASFLAGGEFPVPVVQGATGTVTVEWKEFGVRLNFKPTIAGDVIRLRVRPEVSALDFSNGITLSGFRIPALTTRRAETDVELRDGQSFAIAGLLDNSAQIDRSAIPILGSIPIIGNLFKSKAHRAGQTELMVLITPRLVRALDPDEVPTLPTRPDYFLPQPSSPVAPEDAPPVGPAAGAKKTPTR